MIKKRYWYQFFYGNCPVCGRSTMYKERVYGTKPKAWRRRHILLPERDTYDYCL